MAVLDVPCTSVSVTPSAYEQHSPILEDKCSNHWGNGEFFQSPPADATDTFVKSTIMPRHSSFISTDFSSVSLRQAPYHVSRHPTFSLTRIVYLAVMVVTASRRQGENIRASGSELLRIRRLTKRLRWPLQLHPSPPSRGSVKFCEMQQQVLSRGHPGSLDDAPPSRDVVGDDAAK